MSNTHYHRAADGRAVSVIIAARDAQPWIGRAVASALAQPEAADVVVIDDGSSDETLAAARAADDASGRLVARRLENSVGPAGARNIAMHSSAAPVIAVLDADDYFLPGRLAALLPLMGEADFVADDVALEGATGSLGALLDRSVKTPKQLRLRDFVLGNIARRNRRNRELGFLKPLMRRRFLEERGLAYDCALRLGEDYILYARALALGARFTLAPSCGYVACQRPGSLSRQHEPDELRALLRASERLACIGGLGRDELAALQRHRRRLAAKLQLREVLNAQRAGGMGMAVKVLLSAPGALGYVVGQVLSDKLQALVASCGEAPARAR